MSARTTLKAYFETGDIPTEAEFAELIDSFLNLTDDNSDNITEGATKLFFLASERSKLSGIAAGAEVNPDGVTTGDAEAGVGTVYKLWTPADIAAAIAAQAGGGGWPMSNLQVKATTYQAVNGDNIGARTSTASFTVHPPSSPTVGMRFGVHDAGGNAAGNNITIDFGTVGTKYNSTAANVVLNVNHFSTVWEYTGTAYGWVLISGKIN